MHVPGEDLPKEVRHVLHQLHGQDITYHLRLFDEPAHHARQASLLLGCDLGAVVKSLVLSGEGQQDFYLALVSGNRRVDLHALNEVLGLQLFLADPDDVLAQAGYPVGAVPPFGLRQQLPVVMDADLMDFPLLWASAGSLHAMVGLDPQNLARITRGRILRF